MCIEKTSYLFINNKQYKQDSLNKAFPIGHKQIKNHYDMLHLCIKQEIKLERMNAQY